MKKILLISVLLVSFLLTGPQICLCNEPPSCGSTGWTLIGPPVVGTWVVDYVNGTYPYILSFEFKGCCADCFADCKTSCNVRMRWTDDDLGILPENITLSDIQDYNIGGRGPKNCNPVVNDIEQKNLVITTILKFDNTKDIDNDGYKELVADVVMYYWICPQ